MDAAENTFSKCVGAGVTALWLIGSVLGVAGSASGHTAEEHAAHLEKVRLAASSDAQKYTRSVKAYVVPDLILTDANDRRVRLRELLAGDDPVIMNFIFTSCAAICPVMTKIFSDVPGKLGRDGEHLRMVSISIDPENDTPRKLNAYAKSYQAGVRWQFLTGRTEDIKAVQVAFDNYRGDKMSHEPLTLIRPAPGKPWVRIDGFASPDQLAREYRTTLQH